MVRFMESAIADDKWDIMNKFLNLGNYGVSSDNIDNLMEKK